MLSLFRKLLLSLALFALACILIMRLNRPIILPKDVPNAKREQYRRIAFAGVKNFRDLGGYATSDGKRLKWGVLYRSGHLHKLTAKDLTAFTHLGVRTVLDLRADFERTQEPDHLPADPTIRMVSLPIFEADSALGIDLRKRIVLGDVEGIDVAAMLTLANQQFVTLFTQQFRQLMQEVVAAKGQPLIFHCTEGKDRTGFAAALILRMLGVPQQLIEQDYMLSKQYASKAYWQALFILRLMRGKKTATIARQFAEVEPAYLAAAFATIDQQYGSFSAYLRDGLGLTNEDMVGLQGFLLEER